jgi:hypothetical protein
MPPIVPLNFPYQILATLLGLVGLAITSPNYHPSRQFSDTKL